jgi:lipid-A-disaccharide synthase
MANAGRIVLVAGEPSGDRHGARLAQAIAAHPELHRFRLEGVAGPAMRAAGVVPLARMEDVAVVGFVEILGHLPKLLSVRRTLVRTLEDPATRLFLPIDFPGFNLPLCAVAKRHGLPVLYYIAPQVWAWGKGRLKQLARNVDRLAVVLPFEEAFFRAAGVPAVPVGHPLVESLDPELSCERFRAELGVASDAPLLALLPGSREQEIARLAAPLIETGELLARERPGAVSLLAAASEEQRARIVARHADAVARGLRVVAGRTRETLACARAGIIASGTATLECAALGTPLVAVYRMAGASYALARRLVRLDRFALANLVAGEDVAPELVQGGVVPAKVLAALLPLWDDGPAREKALAGVARVRALLGPPGASERVAALAAELIASRAAAGAGASVGASAEPERAS